LDNFVVFFIYDVVKANKLGCVEILWSLEEMFNMPYIQQTHCEQLTELDRPSEVWQSTFE
jgi:hypothetical protein